MAVGYYAIEEAPVTEQRNKELESVVERIESKLERLEEEREQIKHRVEVKRAQVEELEKALASLNELESNLRGAE